MKTVRSLMAILLCLFCLNSVVAIDIPYANRQKVYPITAAVYQNIKQLYISLGMVQPSSSGPWTADELLRMLKLIPYEELDNSQKFIFDNVYFILAGHPLLTAEDYFGFDISLILSPEIYWHSNTLFNTEPDWQYGFDNRKPAIAVNFEGWATKYFYGYVELSLGLTRYHHDDYPISDGTTTEKLYAALFQSNIPMIGAATLGELSMNIPNRAFLSTGGSNWNLQIGRDRVSWGLGESGNLILGSHVPLHQYLKLTAYNSIFKYTFLTSFFPHPVNYRADEGQSEADFIASKLNNPNYQMQGLSMFMGHRFEFRLFKQKLELVLTETVMYQSLDGYFDIQVLNPLMLFHNLYIRGNANSMLSFSINFAPCKGLNIYGEFAIDDLSVGSEPTVGEDSNPNALAGLGGIKFSVPYGKGAFFGSVEGVYIDPYFYKRDGDVEYIIAVREANNTAGQIDGTGLKYHKYYLGYEYGGDIIVANLKFGYNSPERFVLSLLSQVRFKGLVGIDTPWTKYQNEAPQGAPSTSIQVPNPDGSSNNMVVTGPNEITLVIEPSFSMYMGKGFSFNTQVSFITQWNRRHVENISPVFDVQFAFGLTFRI